MVDTADTEPEQGGTAVRFFEAQALDSGGRRPVHLRGTKPGEGF